MSLGHVGAGADIATLHRSTRRCACWPGHAGCSLELCALSPRSRAAQTFLHVPMQACRKPAQSHGMRGLLCYAQAGKVAHRSQGPQLAVLTPSSTCRALQQQADSMAAQRQVWDTERGSIVADLMQLASNRQASVHAQRDDLGSRIAAARQLSLVSLPQPLACSSAAAALLPQRRCLTGPARLGAARRHRRYQKQWRTTARAAFLNQPAGHWSHTVCL